MVDGQSREKRSKNMLPNREIYFHEDDYCQQQLLPGETAEYVELELGRINDFAQPHRAPGRFGWTDIYVRQEAPVALSAIQISKALSSRGCYCSYGLSWTSAC